MPDQFARLVLRCPACGGEGTSDDQICENCHHGKAAHIKSEGKCLFGAGHMKLIPAPCLLCGGDKTIPIRV